MVTELGTQNEDLPDLGKMKEKGPFTDIEEFFTVVRNAQPGDLITLANGEYDVKDMQRFKGRKGNAENPIIGSIARALKPSKLHFCKLT